MVIKNYVYSSNSIYWLSGWRNISSLESNNSREAEENQLKEKPKILPLRNGPYYLLNDMKPKIVENLQNSKAEPLSADAIITLSLSDNDYYYGNDPASFDKEALKDILDLTEGVGLYHCEQ